MEVLFYVESSFVFCMAVDNKGISDVCNLIFGAKATIEYSDAILPVVSGSTTAPPAGHTASQNEQRTEFFIYNYTIICDQRFYHHTLM